MRLELLAVLLLALRLPRLTLPLPEPAPVSLEPANREGAAPPTPSYAFILHYTQLADVVTTDPTLARLSTRELGRYCEFAAAMPAGVVLRAPTLRSACGASGKALPGPSISSRSPTCTASCIQADPPCPPRTCSTAIS